MTRSTATDLRAIAEQGAARARPDATARAGAGVGRRDVRPPDDRGVEHAGRRAGRPRGEGPAGRRRAVPGDRLPLPRDASARATPSPRSTTSRSSTPLPEHTVAEQDSLLGKDLFAREPDRCCFLRKVVPLRATLAGYDAWVTGVRRVEAPTRANTPLVT